MITQSRLERYEHRTEWPPAAIAILFLALYPVQVLAAPQGRGGTILGTALVAVYAVFVLMIGGISLVGIVTATLASWIVQRVAEEDTANQAATAAQIEQLRQEIGRLAKSVDENAKRQGRTVEGTG